jgi:ribonuclease HII
MVSVQKGREQKLARIGVRDSKMLTRKKREFLYDEIYSVAEDVKFYKISGIEINKAMAAGISLNELEAMHFAKLIDSLKSSPSRIFLDSPDVISSRFGARISIFSTKPMLIAGIKSKKPEDGSNRIRIISEHKADSRYPVVSSASIIAKVVRDNELDRIEEEVGMQIGSGYPSDRNTVEAIRANLNNTGLHQYIRERWKTMQHIRQSKIEDFFG